MRGQRLTGWRRIAMATWRPPGDPQIYVTLDVDATPVLSFIERARRAGHRITSTHLVGRAAARAFHAQPHCNVRIARGRVFRRETVDVFFVAAVGGDGSMSGTKIRRADEKTVYEVARELTAAVVALRGGRDRQFSRATRVMNAVPYPLLRLVLAAASWLAGDLAVRIPALAVHPEPFGSVMITSLGVFGFPPPFGPLSPLYRVPILLCIGEITEKPVAVAGRVEARAVLPLTVTIDHRYFDASHLAGLLKPFQEYLADPTRCEPDP